MKKIILIYALVTLIAVVFTATKLNDYCNDEIRSAIFNAKEPVLEEISVVVDPIEGGAR